MYELKNGILYHDGIAHFALGQSYYPSYHPQKVPVPECGDRLGEMKKDLKDMRDAGFHVVRMAAIGDIGLDDDKNLTLNFPLIDTILKEAAALDMASIVRLQGYSINLHNYENTTMHDQDGKEMPFYWAWFVRNCLNHDGILNDNELVTLESAKHFGQFKDMISFQIYNEAAYPTEGFYDYNPSTLIAYRKWLVDNGLMKQADAKDYEPPRRRPYYDEDPQEWVNFRLFNTERMSGFLNHLSHVAKLGYGKAETLTCHMAAPYLPGNAIMGEDYFDIAEGMDIVGITHYVPTWRTDFFSASLVLDGAESAAAVYGKNAWLIEYNARTACTLNEWERETYNAVGAGFKGILYYEWRADYPFEGAPEPNGFGMIYNDKTKTEKYDGAVLMTKQLDSLSPYIAESKKIRSRIGILYSKHANAYYDAIENGAEKFSRKAKNSNIQNLQRIYTLLKKQGLTPDMVRSCDLEKNPLDLDLLFVPSLIGLSDTEVTEIKEFAKKHSIFYYNPQGDAFIPAEGFCTQLHPEIQIDGNYSLLSLLSLLDVKATVKIESGLSVSASILEGNNAYGKHYLIALVNYDDFERPAENPRLIVDASIVTQTEKVVFITPREKQELVVKTEGNLCFIDLPTLSTGGYVILYNGVFTTL